MIQYSSEPISFSFLKEVDPAEELKDEEDEEKVEEEDIFGVGDDEDFEPESSDSE